MSRRSTFDLLVVGGGPAGCGTAIAATRLGLRVALVEREASRVVRQGESLPPSVRPLLERLGVLDAFLDTGPLACYANRSLWGGDGIAAEYDFLNEPYGAGWQIDRPAVDAMLLGAAEGTGATVLRGRGLRDLRREGSGWLAEVDDAGCVRQVGALVAADTSGRARVVARRVGARFRAVDRLLAAVWHVDAQPGVDTATLVDAVPEGWWYSAFLPNGRLTLVFFTDPHLLRAHGVRAAGGGQRLLLQAPATLSRMSDAGASLAEPPLVVSAASGRLERAAGEGWLAAGDAAATFDPISSHGVGAALDAGMAAASAIRGVLDGDADALDAYEWRVRHGFARYLRIWQTVYQQEDRWPCAPFWRRRHAAAPRSG